MTLLQQEWCAEGGGDKILPYCVGLTLIVNNHMALAIHAMLTRQQSCEGWYYSCVMHCAPVHCVAKPLRGAQRRLVNMTAKDYIAQPKLQA